MGDESGDQVVIRSYLLHDLSDKETEKVELRVMTDPEYARLVDIFESDLVDDYAEGVLSPADRKRFEQVFFPIPERREQVTFAVALRKYIFEHSGDGVERLPSVSEQPRGNTHQVDAPIAGDPTRTSRLFSVWFAAQGTAARIAMAIALLLLCAVIGLLFALRRMRNELDRYRADRASATAPGVLEQQLAQERAQNNALQGELQAQLQQQAKLQDELSRLQNNNGANSSTKDSHQPATTQALVLSPLRLRGDGEKLTILTFSEGAEPPPLRLNLPQGVHYDQYSAVLSPNQEANVQVPGVFHSDRRAKPNADRAGFVLIQLPGRLLKTGDYRLILFGQNRVERTGEDSGSSAPASGDEGAKSRSTKVAAYPFRVLVR